MWGICAAPTASGHGRNAWRVKVLCLIPNTALVAGGEAPNNLAAGMGACMKEHSPGAGMMSTTMQTYSPMLVTESKSVAPELTLMQRPPVAILTERCRHSFQCKNLTSKEDFRRWEAPFGPIRQPDPGYLSTNQALRQLK